MLGGTSSCMHASLSSFRSWHSALLVLYRRHDVKKSYSGHMFLHALALHRKRALQKQAEKGDMNSSNHSLNQDSSSISSSSPSSPAAVARINLRVPDESRVTGLPLVPVLESDSSLVLDMLDVPERERKCGLLLPLRAGVARAAEGRWNKAESE